MVLFPGGLGSASWQHLGRWRDHKGMALWYIMQGRANWQAIPVRILALMQQSHLSEVATVTERILQSYLRGGITFDAPQFLDTVSDPPNMGKTLVWVWGGWAKLTRLNLLSTQVGWWLETEIKLIYSHKRDSFIHKRFILFFFLIIIYLFIYGCVGSSFLCQGFLQLRRAGATLHRGARASHYCGLSCCGAQAPDTQAQ